MVSPRSRQISFISAKVKPNSNPWQPRGWLAEHPTSQLANVALVGLDPIDPVAQEWHLIILSPSYTAMVLCQELSATDYGVAGEPTADLERKFYGFWTFEPALVQETVEIAIAHINRYNPKLAENLTAQVQSIVTAAPTAEPDDLGDIVSRVVDYLQTSQEDVSHLDISIQHKALDQNLVSNELQAFLRLAQLIDSADARNPMAAAEVAALAETMGQLLDLPAWQLKRLRLAGLLHRIAPATVSVQYGDEAPCCPLVPAAQILRTMPRTRAIAQIITHQNEWWNGNGQPAGLAGEKIPLESRILGLIAAFKQRVTQLQAAPGNVESMPDTSILNQVVAEFRQSGDRWEPKLVDTLELLVMGLQQGLSLSVTSPKISAGMWLIDPPTGIDTHAEKNRVRSEV
jgi:HD-GYP domain-containing protein (c-di-GMP phosphodiesterase class II)